MIANYRVFPRPSLNAGSIRCRCGSRYERMYKLRVLILQELHRLKIFGFPSSKNIFGGAVLFMKPERVWLASDLPECQLVYEKCWILLARMLNDFRG